MRLVRAVAWRAATACLLLMLLIQVSSAFGQTPPRRTCLPISERAGRDVGCWLLVAEPLGRLTGSEVFWHLDTYPTRAAAEAAKGPRGAVVEALGKVWLFTIGEAGWRPSGGVRVAEVGPIFVKSGEEYTAQYAEGISNPGDVTPKHRHPGPEAWYRHSANVTGSWFTSTPRSWRRTRSSWSVPALAHSAEGAQKEAARARQRDGTGVDDVTGAALAFPLEAHLASGGT